MTKRIPAHRVVELTQPAIVASEGGGAGHPITIVPLLDGEQIAGFEIRCQCGAQALVDCVYEAEQPVPATSPDTAPEEAE